MQLFGQLPEGPPDIVLGGALGDAEDCVRVIGHGGGILVVAASI